MTIVQRARSVWRHASAAHDLRRRTVPRLSVGPAAGAPTVYYLVPDEPAPHGGVRVAYRHVDELNRMGWSASVLHTSDSRARWFANSTRVTSSAAARLSSEDVLVVPEWYGPSLASIDPRLRVLVFNQGAYITFGGIDPATATAGAPYAGLPNLLGLMTVSQDSAELLRLAFPRLRVDVARPVVDPRLFHPGDGPREVALAYTPSRRPEELHLVLHLLRAVGVDWPLVPISGLSEAEVAETLRRVPLYLSLSERDGFGLPPAEAMACGAYVVGYHGGGGKEFFDPSYCSPVTDTAELVETVRSLVSRPLPELAELGARASEAILARYDAAGLQADLRAVYEPLLPRATAPRHVQPAAPVPSPNGGSRA